MQPVEREDPRKTPGAEFDAYYYANCCGRPYVRDEHWLRFFGLIADRIVADFAPHTVIDAGCAIGMLVEALRARGIEASGVDISSYAIEQVPAAIRPYCQVGSITDPFAHRADLIVCIEVVEHMPPDASEAAIANICAHTDDVLFSSSPHDYREPTHVNVRAPEDWAEQFARHQFFRDPEFDATFIAPWAVRFRKSTEPVHKLIRAFERRLARSEQERYDMRSFNAEAQGKQAAAEQMTAHVRDVLMREVEALRAQVAALQAEIDPVRADAHAARQAEHAANDRARFTEQTIKNMEQSIFWKLRRLLRRS